MHGCNKLFSSFNKEEDILQRWKFKRATDRVIRGEAVYKGVDSTHNCLPNLLKIHIKKKGFIEYIITQSMKERKERREERREIPFSNATHEKEKFSLQLVR